MEISKATSRRKRLFLLQDIHYNKILKTEVLKEKEIKP